MSYKTELIPLENKMANKYDERLGYAANAVTYPENLYFRQGANWAMDELKKIIEWASGENFDIVVAKYETHKKAFPEFHE